MVTLGYQGDTRVDWCISHGVALCHIQDFSQMWYVEINRELKLFKQKPFNCLITSEIARLFESEVGIPMQKVET